MTLLARYLPHTTIAYLTMEIALRPDIPTYSGGLGILAGDAARSAADLQLPMVFVTLVSRRGYLQQTLDPFGRQVDAAQPWDPAIDAKPLDAKIAVEIAGRPVWIQAWLHVLQQPVGAVPVLLLDTDLPENAAADRRITDVLYGGGPELRLQQEIVLGIGGEAMLRALGFSIDAYHLNEGHAALLTLALLRRFPLRKNHVETGLPFDAERVLERCIFTTHTPVEAGHDRFDYALVRALLGDYLEEGLLRQLAGADMLNMTRLALNLCGYVNGVARRHGETTRHMFPGYRIRSITNGVHPQTWTHPAMAALFDGLAEDWRHQPEALLRAETLPSEAVAAAHRQAKAELLALVRDRTGHQLDDRLPTLVFARRMTGYKRAELLLQDPERLLRIASNLPFQIVFAGKAHPHDEDGKALIARLQETGRRLGDAVPLAFVPGYDFGLAKILVAGADVWLNTPLPPLEASGTSGMKAALNGVPSLSTLDGWWIEGCIEGITGWAIGSDGDAPEQHGTLLLDKLEQVVLPLFHHDQAGWSRVMTGAISRCGALFTSHRMMRRYAAEAYLGSVARAPI